MLSVLFIFSGCEKEQSMISSDLKKDVTSEKFKVVDGVLHIGDSTNYRENTLEVMNMSEPKFREWERKLGFKSLRTWIREANDAMDRTSNMEELAVWKEKYGDILEIGETEIKPFIDDIFAQCFGNREGNFYAGKYFAKAISGKTIYLLDGTNNKIDKHISEIETDLDRGLIVLDHKKYRVTRNGCPSQDLWRKHGNHGVMFRFEINARFEPLPSSRLYTQIKIELYAKKKNWLGKWKDDTADLKWMESEWRVADYNGIQYGENYPSTATSSNMGCGCTHKIQTLINCLDATPASEYIMPEFDYKKAKGTSNYLDWNKYAVHCCGFPTSQCPDADG